MIYKFICPECGQKQEISMRMESYTANGHFCSCGAEMIRDPDDFCRNYAVNCDGFYAEHQSN